jgi:hypothetical protein
MDANLPVGTWTLDDVERYLARPSAPVRISPL